MHIVSPAPIVFEEIIAFAQGADRLVFSEDAKQRIADSHEAFLQIAARREVYGFSTGVGARRNAQVFRDKESCIRLWKSHALQFGEELDIRRKRATVLIRAAQLALGGSGVSLPLAEGMLSVVADLPDISMKYGTSLGTGDLSSLSALALHIIEQDVPFAASDGLSFMSSSALTFADAALSLHDLEHAMDVSMTLAAVTARVTQANVEHYSRSGLEGERDEVLLVADHVAHTLIDPAARVQDPFALRLIPQSIGSVFRVLHATQETLLHFINRKNENPVLDSMHQQVFHTGNFSTLELAVTVSSLVQSLAHEASLLMSRISLLFDDQYTHASDFLTDGKDDSSGAMMLEYAAAAALGEIREAAASPSTHGIHISQGAEEYAPFTPLAIRRLREATHAYRIMLACLSVALGRIPSAHSAVEGIPKGYGDLGDRNLSPDLAFAFNHLDAVRLKARAQLTTRNLQAEAW